METPLQSRHAVEREIRVTFRGVTLDRGISLRQAQSADNFRHAVGNTSSTKPLNAGITNDWSQVRLDELEGGGIAHLDALGFRYYLPALMLSVLNHYESSSIRVIGTLTALYPKRDESWEYHMHRYSLLNPAQKSAIALFLVALPKLVELDIEGQKVVERGLRNYWGEYLQRIRLDSP